MIPVAGYADRFSVRPGETIHFHVANATDEQVTARLVRVICADPNPAGPGIHLEPIESEPVVRATPGREKVPHGSYGFVDGLAPFINDKSFSFVCRVCPTHLEKGEQTIVSCGFSISVNSDGHLHSTLGDHPGPKVQHAMVQGDWYLVWLRFDAPSGAAQLGHIRLSDQHVARAELETTPVTTAGRLLFAAADAALPRNHFNGRLEAPMVFDRAISSGDLAALSEGRVPGDAVAEWDFSIDVSTPHIEDVGPNALHGSLVNTPTRAITGSLWTGQEMCFRHAPREYAAIHFHDDDIDDCHWPVAFEWTVPEGTRSAVYALMLSAAGAQENVPFFVVPPKGKATAKIAVLASTFTYTVYGNHARPEWGTNLEWTEAWQTQANEWGAYPHNPGSHPEYGYSTYNRHPDGSGISIASWLRPMFNVRIGFITYPVEAIRGSGMRHFPADSHLTAWLEAKGYDYDIITDAELHAEGYDLLKSYRVVLTGSHPEYHTREMLDGLEQYRDNGGRFCYLGGNGFYWKIALSPTKEGVIEIRRGEGGIRAWAAEPGEYYNQFDGEYGGMWRRNARPPQKLCGIGFTAQGNFLGSYYRKRPDVATSRVAWILEGIDDDVFGNHGLSGHGAAGFELDRADKRLGTPEHAVILASSENHPPDAPWVLVPEEHLTHLVTWPGEPIPDLIRSDIVFFETPGGGAVFSTGSITFCGSLVTNNHDNDVSTLMQNVITRFLDLAPFEMPN